jgi:hypothetical protein
VLAVYMSKKRRKTRKLCAVVQRCTANTIDEVLRFFLPLKPYFYLSICSLYHKLAENQGGKKFLGECHPKVTEIYNIKSPKFTVTTPNLYLAFLYIQVSVNN